MLLTDRAPRGGARPVGRAHTDHDELAGPLLSGLSRTSARPAQSLSAGRPAPTARAAAAAASAQGRRPADDRDADGQAGDRTGQQPVGGGPPSDEPAVSSTGAPAEPA